MDDENSHIKTKNDFNIPKKYVIFDWGGTIDYGIDKNGIYYIDPKYLEKIIE